MKRGGPEVAGGGLPWPNELQSLLMRAAIGPDDQVEPSFRAWRARVDIDDHLDGGTFRLLPLVYARMRALNIDDPLMGRLKGVYRRSWYETQTFFGAVAPAVAALEAAGVRTMILKGAPLAIGYYRSHATRPMFDLDVLTHYSQAKRALDVLRDAGWTPGSSVRAYELVDSHALDLKRDGGAEIDIHWRCLREAPSDGADDWFWERAVPFEFGGVQTLQPGPTAMLPHLVVHGVRSNLEPPIRWIADAATVIRTAGDAIDWAGIVGFARSQKLCHRLSLGLEYLAAGYGVPVPGAVLAELKAAGVSMIERIENHVYLGPAQRLHRPRLFPLVDYWRFLRDRGMMAFALGYPAYLTRRWQLRHPLLIPVEAVAALARRIRSPG